MANNGQATTTKNGTKSNFSIDSLLDERLGGMTSTTGNERRRSAEENNTIRQVGQPMKYPYLETIRGPFISPFLLPRWPIMHPTPTQTTNLNFAAVAPIWAMAAQAAAATGIAGSTVFHGTNGVGNAEPRRQQQLNKPPPVKKYKCDVCGKAFSRSNTLVTHKRIHSGEKPFSCEHCGRAFRQPGNLTRHRLTHTTVKPYVCGQCGKAFNRASNLHTHMRTHSDYRPHSCPFCAKSFHQKVDMKIHSYTHTGDKQVRCTTCHKGYSLPHPHRGHEDPVKNGGTYSCEYCGKCFLYRTSLKSHISSNHPRKNDVNGL